MGNNQLKQLHDKLLAEKPNDASHIADACPFCVMESVNDNKGDSFDDQPEGGSMSEGTKKYDENELKAAVDKAVAEATSALQSQLSEREKSDHQAAIDSAVAAAKAESETVVKDLQSKLDSAVLEAANEKKAREEFEASVEAAKEAEKAAEELAKTKAERTELVKEVTPFTDEYVEKNIDRWALYDAEEFSRFIEDCKIASSAKTDEKIPAKTAMQASRIEQGGKETGSALGSLGDLRRELRTNSL